MQKRTIAEYVEEVKELEEGYEGEEFLQVSWLDAVPSAGEHNEWVLHVGSVIIEDGFETEEAANDLYEKIEGAR